MQAVKLEIYGYGWSSGCEIQSWREISCYTGWIFIPPFEVWQVQVNKSDVKCILAPFRSIFIRSPCCCYFYNFLLAILRCRKNLSLVLLLSPLLENMFLAGCWMLLVALPSILDIKIQDALHRLKRVAYRFFFFVEKF